jgi:hypothetical protein
MIANRRSCYVKTEVDMESFEITRYFFLRALALMYCFAFAVTGNQFRALCGSHGVLPVTRFLANIRWQSAPSLFYLYYSDRFATYLAWTGFALSVVALSGLLDQAGFFPNIALWLALWVIYLSFENTGQIFYGFGWETLLLESGFLAIFLAPSRIQTPEVLIWLGRWILFRVMFGAGLIKLRADACWWDLTCLQIHYQTQPMPNPLSWYFHHMPKLFHKFCVLFTHFVELVVPWGYFLPQPISAICGAVTIYFQLMLILSGNLSWLNWLTIVLCIFCFSDSFLSWGTPAQYWSYAPVPFVWEGVVWIYAAVVLLLSIRPVMNLISSHQAMNTSYEPFHIVNTYGAFGAITKRRFEIVVEGTHDPILDDKTVWKEYAFKGKPGDPNACPPIVAPYHLRLDWLMWFAAMSSVHRNSWFVRFVYKLLEGDQAVLALLKSNPFPDNPPYYVRAQLYEYEFTEWKSTSKAWWKRRLVGQYMSPEHL